MGYWVAMAICVTLALPLAVFFGAPMQGRSAVAAMEAISRQPEAAGDIRSTLILALALIESLVIYVLLTFFLLMSKLPAVEKVMEVLKGAGG